jgi:hypothetical protein
MGQPPFYVYNATFRPEMHRVQTLWGEEDVATDAADHVGRLWRKCTREYKLNPIRRKVRELMREAGARHVHQWIGISTDEAHRMKPSGVRYITNEFPLVAHGLSRMACRAWLVAHGYPDPPKSSCLGCPFHDDAYWVQLRETSPDEWADTVKVDHAIRHGIPGARGAVYMHRSCVPLEDVLFRPRAGMAVDQLNWTWAAECEGICGI